MEDPDTDHAKRPAEEDVGDKQESLEKIGQKLKEVSDRIGCKANVALDNFGKHD